MDNDVSNGYKIFTSILNGLALCTSIVIMILFIIIFKNSLDIVFISINSSFLILGICFNIFYIIFDKYIFKILSDNFFIVSVLFLLLFLLFNDFFIFNKWLIFGFLVFFSIITIIFNSINSNMFNIYTSIINVFILILLSILYLNIFTRSFLLFSLSIICLIISIILNLFIDKYSYNRFYAFILYYLFMILNYIIIFIYL